MKLIPLTIKGISYSQTQTGAYALILSERVNGKKLPIIIGSFEAQSIAIGLEKEINPPRPLTHDLFKRMADLFDISLSKVVIERLIDGVFYATVYLKRAGYEYTMDARTSDAVALAIRFRAPMFTTEEILEKAGIELEELPGAGASKKALQQPSAPAKSKPEPQSEKNALRVYSREELERMLREALDKEDYELAANIRDELERRGLR